MNIDCYANPAKLYARLPSDLMNLDTDRIHSLMEMDTKIFLDQLNPVKVQPYEKLMIITGFHDTYVAIKKNIEIIPITLVDHFDEEHDYPYLSVLEMQLVSNAEYQSTNEASPEEIQIIKKVTKAL